ncbi:MAG: 50S ribosomal protein L21 [Patescibacteria group bacterium]|mgnify:CR=1 FL=1
MKIAVIQTGGKQYLVKEGDKIKINKIKNHSQKEIVFNDILFYSDNEKTLIGQPKLDNVEVIGEVLEEKKEKILVWKYKPKTRYRKKKGYKNYFFIVKVKEIKEK